MSSNFKSLLNRLQWWSMLIIALLFFVSELVENSMYIDGVWYAVISQNLATGQGSAWFPQFSKTIFAAFHEHPPGMFWAQAVFFKIFGGGWLTERLFSLTLYLTTAFLIVHFWKKTFQNNSKPDSVSKSQIQQFWFIPILLWQVNLASYYFQPANLLEAPLVILDLISIAFLWKVAEGRKVYLNLLVAAFCLGIAFLTKGFVGLFPLAFLGIYWLVFRSTSFFKTIIQTSLLLVFLAAFFGILFWIEPLALESLKSYLDVQVMASLQGERRLYFYRNSRFYILGQMVLVTLPMLLFVLFNMGVVKFWLKKPIEIRTFFKSRVGKLAVVFFLIALSASLPIMLSPRQALPYLLPSIPFFSLAFGIVGGVYFKKWWSVFIRRQKFLLIKAEGFLVLTTVCAFCLCISKFEKPNKRDAAVIHDADKIGAVVGTNHIISSTHYDMYISGYLMRFNQISLDTSDLSHEYLLLPKGELILEGNYQEVLVDTKLYRLFKKF